MKVYFANLPTDKIGSELNKRVIDYYDYITISGIINLWRLSYYQYFKATKHLGQIPTTGEVGEYSAMYINHYRSLLQGILNMTVALASYAGR